MIHAALHAVTNLGDSATTASFSLGLALYLFTLRQKRAATALLSAYALTAFCIALGKIIIYSRCQPTDILFHLRSPSGHSALSLVAYGMFCAFVSSSLNGWRRLLPYMVLFAFIAVIAASRVILGYHTLSDVGGGLLIGTAASVGMWLLFLHKKRVYCPWGPFIILALILLAFLHGRELPAEDLIEALSNYIRRHFRPC